MLRLSRGSHSKPLEVCTLFLIGVLAIAHPTSCAFAEDPFPRQGQAVQQHADQIIDQVKSGNPGRSIGQDFLNRGPNYTRKHPWINGNPNWAVDWRTDSLAIVERNSDKFWECVDPRLVEQPCDYCQPHFNGLFVEDRCFIPFMNPGEVVEYWWPELEIEVNNFGISVIDPSANGKLEYARQQLIQRLQAQFPNQIDQYLRRYGATSRGVLPQGLKQDPHAGNSHFAGLDADQTQVAEGHHFLTEVQDRASKLRTQGAGYCGKLYVRIYNQCIEVGDFWYNGWLKGNSQKCFYDTLDPKDKVIKPWTEDMKFAPTWRFPFKSKDINKDFYKASVPFELTNDAQRNLDLVKNSTYFKDSSCDSFRLQQWPEIYEDLRTALQIVGKTTAPLDTICYKGGDQLYPLTGALIKEHNELAAGAFLSRRALELVGMLGDNHLNSRNSSSDDDSSYWRKHGWEHINKFTRLKRSDYDLKPDLTELDKLQRVSPDVTRCFHMGEVGEYDDQTRRLFPPDGVRPSSNGSVRYIYWNKRKMCSCEMRGKLSALEKDAGNDSCTEDWMKSAWGLDNKGWGCQLYPRKHIDEARGNIEEGKIEGSPSMIAKLPIACVFPFRGFSLCGFLDSMDRNSNSSGSNGGSNGGSSGGSNGGAGGNFGGGMIGGGSDNGGFGGQTGGSSSQNGAGAGGSFGGGTIGGGTNGAGSQTGTEAGGNFGGGALGGASSGNLGGGGESTGGSQGIGGGSTNGAGGSFGGGTLGGDASGSGAPGSGGLGDGTGGGSATSDSGRAGPASDKSGGDYRF